MQNAAVATSKGVVQARLAAVLAVKLAAGIPAGEVKDVLPDLVERFVQQNPSHPVAGWFARGHRGRPESAFFEMLEWQLCRRPSYQLARRAAVGDGTLISGMTYGDIRLTEMIAKGVQVPA